MTNRTTAELLAELREKLELAKEPGGAAAASARPRLPCSYRPPARRERGRTLSASVEGVCNTLCGRRMDRNKSKFEDQG